MTEKFGEAPPDREAQGCMAEKSFEAVGFFQGFSQWKRTLLGISFTTNINPFFSKTKVN